MGSWIIQPKIAPPYKDPNEGTASRCFEVDTVKKLHLRLRGFAIWHFASCFGRLPFRAAALPLDVSNDPYLLSCFALFITRVPRLFPNDWICLSRAARHRLLSRHCLLCVLESGSSRKQRNIGVIVGSGERQLTRATIWAIYSPFSIEMSMLERQLASVAVNRLMPRPILSVRFIDGSMESVHVT